MTVALTIAGVTYNYPVQTDELWATDATDWAVAVTNELNELIVDGDIGPNTLVIVNNDGLTHDVDGLAFSTANIRSAVVEYYVYRSYNSGASEVAEAGHLYLLYRDIANSWTITQIGNSIGEAQVNFSITAGGQVRYTATPLAATHVGRIKYRARVLQKT